MRLGWLRGRRLRAQPPATETTSEGRRRLNARALTPRYVVGVAVRAFVVSMATIALPALADKADNSVRFTYIATLDSADPYFTNSRIAIIVADSVWRRFEVLR